MNLFERDPNLERNLKRLLDPEFFQYAKRELEKFSQVNEVIKLRKQPWSMKMCTGFLRYRKLAFKSSMRVNRGSCNEGLTPHIQRRIFRVDLHAIKNLHHEG
ncbi:hypothetical protein LCL95_08605 [Bacillus timonensis]|nr:hypothetical protein [Bacillus timonensis]